MPQTEVDYSYIEGPARKALQSLTPSQINFIKSLPKAELHAHLNGSIPIPILQTLASSHLNQSQHKLKGQSKLVQEGIRKLVAGVTLIEISDFFDLFPAIYALTSTPETLAIATRGVLDHFLGGVEPECSYLELRSTPRETEYMSREVYLKTILDVIVSHPCYTLPSPSSSSSSSCGDADVDVNVEGNSYSEGSRRIKRNIGLIVSLDRKMAPTVLEEILGLLKKFKKLSPELPLIGVDICGDPLSGDVDDFNGVLKEVKELGLGVTVHIAETEKNTEEETMKLLQCMPDRLGHATFLNEEAKNVVVERKNLCVEVCLSSNLLCKTVSSLEDHHIGHYLKHNHPIAISTDDILPFRTTLTAEYALLLAKQPLGLGLSEDEVTTIAQMSLDSRFRA